MELEFALVSLIPSLRHDVALNIYQVNRSFVIVTCEGQVHAAIEDCAIRRDKKIPGNDSWSITRNFLNREYNERYGTLILKP